MRVTNKFDLPEPVVNALSQDKYSKGESNRSITQLIDSPRVRILRAEHPDVLEQDASELIWSALGNAVHNLFEEAATDPNHISEERYFTSHSGWVISGAIDLQIVNDDKSRSLRDYKCTSVWSVIYGKKEWETQLNGYAWLLRHSHAEINETLYIQDLKIIAVLRDWNRREAARRDDYPRSPIMEVDIPLWLDDVQDNYFNERIELHQDAEFNRLSGEPLPLCSPDERWEKPTTYAVKKGKNKRAIRVLQSMEEAQHYIQDKQLDANHHVEERPGECRRCIDNYCGVADVCDQFNGQMTL